MIIAVKGVMCVRKENGRKMNGNQIAMNCNLRAEKKSDKPEWEPNCNGRLWRVDSQLLLVECREKCARQKVGIESCVDRQSRKKCSFFNT